MSNYLKRSIGLILLSISTIYFTLWSVGLLVSQKISPAYVRSSNHTRLKHSEFCTGYIRPATQIINGLGNWMFQYASVFGIARSKGMTMFVDQSVPNYFGNLSAKHVKLKLSRTLSEKKGWCCKYNRELKRHINCSENIAISGLLMSYKHFEEYRNEIRQEFQFMQGLQDEADEILKRGIAKHFKIDGKLNIKTVGIHIRRGDYASPSAYRRGFLAGDSKFVQKAIEYLKSDSKLQIQKTRLLYFVVSQNPKWCRTEFRNFSNFVIVEQRKRELGMCLLSRCDYLILPSSSSTFGWWAGYLTKGSAVLYNKEFARPGSFLEKIYSPVDFFPPNWIPI